MNAIGVVTNKSGAEEDSEEDNALDYLQECQEMIIEVLQDNLPIVRALEAKYGRDCAICGQKHQTIKIYLLRKNNIPFNIQQRIKQMKVCLKDEIES